MISVIAIAAMDESRVIGYQNKLPWHLPEDFKHFSQLTTGNTVLMGKNTFWSLPEKFRPLPRRQNVVVSTTMKDEKGITVVSSPFEYIKKVKSGELKIRGDKLWIIGGEQIYRSTMELWDMVELTLVDGKHQGDTYFPSFETGFKLILEEKSVGCSFLTYSRITTC